MPVVVPPPRSLYRDLRVAAMDYSRMHASRKRPPPPPPLPPASFHDSAKWNHGTLDARGASSLSLSRVTRLLSRVIIQCFSSTRRDVSVRERGWKEGGILFPFSPPARTDATRAIAPGKCISERCMATLPRKLRRRGHRRKGQSRAVEERR